MKKYLEIRIKELKEADVKACKNRWDMSKPANERGIWREQSNEITARIHELEATLKFLNLDSDNCAIIHTVKDSWSREEVKKLTEEAFYEGIDTANRCDDMVESFTYWIKENL